MFSKGLPGKTILVVDNDEAIRDALRLFLIGEGFAVATADNGQEALDQLGANRPAPDLILLDLMMPVKNGYEFRQEQLQEPALACIPVIVFSAAGDLSKSADLLADVGRLQKPLDGDLLLAAIDRFTVSH